MREPYNRDPAETVAAVAAETVPGLAAAGHMVGLGHIAMALKDARQRVREGHRAMARAAGMEDLVGQNAEEDMNITVTGDVHSHQQAPQIAPAASGLVKPILPWVLAAASSAGLLGWGAANMMAPKPVGQTIQKTEGFLIELVPGKK